MRSAKARILGIAANRVALVVAAAALALSCGRRSPTGQRTPETGGRAGGGAGGGASAGAGGDGNVGSAGAGGTVPIVDPSVSAQWTWHACGMLAAAVGDVSAVMAPDGSSVAIVDETNAVRIHDLAAPSRRQPVGKADFMVYAPDATLLLGTVSDSQGFVLQPVLAGQPVLTFALPDGASCGHGAAAFSTDGSLFMVDDGPRSTNGRGHSCVWNVADGAWSGALNGGEAFRGHDVVSLGCEGGFHVSMRSPSGTVLSTVALESESTFCPTQAWISPTGDRVSATNDPGWQADSDTGAILWDADTGKRLVTVSFDQWVEAGEPDGVFAPSGDRVLLGDGVFLAKDGVRLGDAGVPRDVIGRLALSSDGRTAVSILNESGGKGAAALVSLTDKRTLELLGPPPRQGIPQHQSISDLALSGDGGLLVLQTFAGPAFVLRLAASLEDSVTLWPMSSSLGLTADISASGTFAATSGDERQLYRVEDGARIWDSVPSPTVGPGCTGTQLRLSPTGRWAAGTGDSNMDVFLTASAMPWQLAAVLPSGCQDAAVFSRDESLMATSTPALYRTGEQPREWRPVWAKIPAPLPDTSTGSLAGWGNEVRFSPDETKLLVSQCQAWTCDARLYGLEDGALLQSLPALTAPHPSFSPEGHWVVAGATLQHLPSGATRAFDASGNVTVAIFTPNGDIIAGASDQSITRYCRDP